MLKVLSSRFEVFVTSMVELWCVSAMRASLGKIYPFAGNIYHIRGNVCFTGKYEVFLTVVKSGIACCALLTGTDSEGEIDIVPVAQWIRTVAC